MLPFATLLLSRTGLKIGIGAVLALGAYSWHASALRNAKQEAQAETRSEVVTELEAQHAVETQKYQERVTELEQRVAEVTKARLGSVRVVEVTAKQSETQREEAPRLDTNTRRAEIRARINRPAGLAAATVQ